VLYEEKYGTLYYDVPPPENGLLNVIIFFTQNNGISDENSRLKYQQITL
jgi:hypothetical protein